MGCNCGKRARRVVTGQTTRTSSLTSSGTTYNILDSYGRIIGTTTSLTEASRQARAVGGTTSPA